jgi:predicted PilT family ATPase
MQLYIARESANGQPRKQVTPQEIEESLKDTTFFYLDRENEQKDLNELTDYFEDRGFSVHLREVKYALGELDYIYELHIV